jgi:hypothetical protein
MAIDKRLIDRARELFATVYDDGDRVRIYPTSFYYETPITFRTNEALAEYIEAEEEALADFYGELSEDFI